MGRKILYTLRRAKTYLIKCLYERDVIISPGDFLYIRGGVIEFYQIIIGVRILDIENWQNYRDINFYYTNLLSAAYDSNADILNNNSRFIALLESFERNGYDNNSRLGISRDFIVNDGTHRAALAWCYGFVHIPAHQTPSQSFFGFPIPERVSSKIDYADMRKIIGKLLAVQDELKEKGYTLCCRGDGLSNEQIANLELDLSKVCSIIKLYKNSKGFLFTLLPITFDYFCHNKRFAFKSVSNYKYILQKKYHSIILVDNFVDGKILFDQFQK